MKRGWRIPGATTSRQAISGRSISFRQSRLRFTFSPDTDIYPLWTPDGSTIIYFSFREGMVAKALFGTAAARLLVKPTSSLLIPSQIIEDGQRLLFFGDMGTSTGFDIFTMPISGGPPAPIVQGPLTDVEPQVSPDGRWIAYSTTDTTGNYDLFVQPLPPTGQKWQVSTAGGRQPMWRRDGRELYFVTSAGRFYAVDVSPGTTFEFGTPQVLFDMPSITTSVRNSYVPSRDGKRFLVNKLLDAAVLPINVVVNWASATEK